MLKPLIIGAVGLAMLAACDQTGRQYVTINPESVQAKIEEMTGLPPAQQCALYFEVKKYAPAKYVEKAAAIIESQNFSCAPALIPQES